MSSKLIKALASSHEETRDEAIESVGQYVQTNGEKLTSLDLEKLWKGLYYAVWFSDGAENQQNLCEQLSIIFNNNSMSLRTWTQAQKAFWNILIKEWASIDQWRMDKYYLLIRRMLRGNFRYLAKKDWNSKVLKQFNDIIKEPLGLNKNMAISYHLCDIYMEELKRNSTGGNEPEQSEPEQPEQSEEQSESESESESDETSIPESVLQPFQDLMKTSKSKTLKAKITEEVLDNPITKKWWGTEETPEEEDEEDEWHGF